VGEDMRYFGPSPILIKLKESFTSGSSTDPLAMYTSFLSLPKKGKKAERIEESQKSNKHFLVQYQSLEVE